MKYSFKKLLTLHYRLILCLLIFLQTLALIFTFSTKREGFHSDENWSYGYANSFFQSNIYIDNNKKSINTDKWEDSSILRDYIEVQNGERFRFDSVFDNMTEDFSPPLHSLILHGICSFFPESFSWWYGFSINIVAFILSIWLLFFVSKNLFNSIYVSLLTCFFYGFSSAALNCFIYIRTYSILTCFSLALIYLVTIFLKSKTISLKVSFLIYLISILGFLSHYFFYAFAFSLSLAFIVNLAARKKIKHILVFSFSMLLAVLSSLVIFPSTIHMVLKGQSLYAQHMPLLWEMKYCINLCFLETLGILPVYPSSVTWCILKFACIFMSIILSGFLFLFRKEPWFKKFIEHIKAKLNNFFIHFPAKIKNMFKSFWGCLLFSFCFTLVIVAKISNVYVMSIYTDRYLFFIIPVFILCVIKVIYTLLQYFFKQRKKFILPLLSLVLMLSLILVQSKGLTHYYFKRNTNTPTLTSLTKDANVIVTLKSDWHYVCYTTLLRNSRQIFVCQPDSEKGLDYMKPSLEQINNTLPVYLVMEEASLSGKKQSSGTIKMENFNNEAGKIFTSGYTEKDLVNFFSSCSWCTSVKKMQEETSFQGKLIVYQLR